MSARDGHEYLETGEYEAWHGLLSLNRQVLAALDAALRAESGLSVTEFDVLITLYNAPERRLGMTALATSVMLSPSGLTHLVTRLERSGLVSRSADPGDGRKFFATLTSAGDARLRQARRTHNDVLRTRLLGRLTASERRTLAGLWRRLG